MRHLYFIAGLLIVGGVYLVLQSDQANHIQGVIAGAIMVLTGVATIWVGNRLR